MPRRPGLIAAFHNAPRKLPKDVYSQSRYTRPYKASFAHALFDQIDKLATEHRMSLNAVINFACQEYVEKHGAPTTEA